MLPRALRRIAGSISGLRGIAHATLRSPSYAKVDPADILTFQRILGQEGVITDVTALAAHKRHASVPLSARSACCTTRILQALHFDRTAPDQYIRDARAGMRGRRLIWWTSRLSSRLFAFLTSITLKMLSWLTGSTGSVKRGGVQEKLAPAHKLRAFHELSKARTKRAMPLHAGSKGSTSIAEASSFRVGCAGTSLRHGRSGSRQVPDCARAY